MTPGRPFGSTKLRWFLTCNRLKQHKWSPRRACRFWWRHCLRMSIPLHEPEGWAEKTKEAIDAYRSQSYPIIRSGMVWGTWNKIGTTKSTSRTSTSSDSLWSVCVVSGTKQRKKKKVAKPLVATCFGETRLNQSIRLGSAHYRAATCNWLPQGWYESLVKCLTLHFNHCKSRASSPWEVQPVAKDSLEISKASTFQSAKTAPGIVRSSLSSWHCQCCAKIWALERHKSQVLPAITQVGSRHDKAYGGEKLSTVGKFGQRMESEFICIQCISYNLIEKTHCNTYI